MDNKQNSKILPMTYPAITSYPIHANILSILSHNEDNLTWFLNHYFQVCWHKNGNYCPNFNIAMSYMPFLKACPLITFHGLSREFISGNWNYFSDFIVSCIDSGYYLYFLIDKYYIPAYEGFYLRHHYQHEILVYGYDKTTETVYIADFFKNFKYNYSSCRFQDITDGYMAQNKSDWFKGCLLLKENPGNHSLDIDLLKTFISDYLDSYNSNKRFLFINNEISDDAFVFGLSIYSLIINHIQKIFNDNIDFDIRPYHFLWDHKKFILMLTIYLNKQGYLNDSDKMYKSFMFIERKALLLRDLMLKYMVTKNKAIFSRAINIVKDLENNEKLLLKELLGNINKVPAPNILPSNKLFDCESIHIDYFGEWHKDISGFFYTKDTNSYVRFVFYGSSIKYIGEKNNHSGYSEIYLDGIKCKTTNLYSSEELKNITLFYNNDLLLGNHIIHVACSGLKDSDSSGNEINIAGFETSCDANSAEKIKNVAIFNGIDTITKGSWKISYGSEGYDIIGVEKKIPLYVNIKYINAFQHIWNDNSTDIRVLETPLISQSRVASCKYNKNFFTLDLVIAGENLVDTSFYILDFDRHNRKIYIEIIEFETKQIIDHKIINDVHDGVYLKYKMRGHFLINFHNRAYPDAVLSGVFFDK